MDLSDRSGRDASDMAGMAWDEIALVLVVTSSVCFTAIKVYKNNRCRALKVELYIGIRKQAILGPCFDITLDIAKNTRKPVIFSF